MIHTTQCLHSPFPSSPPLLPAGFLFCPESPAWLELQEQRREAAAVAEQLWGPEGSAQLGGGALAPRDNALRACCLP